MPVDVATQQWHLKQRARILASVHLTQDLTLRVDDVSRLDLGLDLLVRPRDPAETWAVGVVTRGLMELPDESEHRPHGFVRLATDVLALPSARDLPDMPVVLMLYTMADDEGYAGLVMPRRVGRVHRYFLARWRGDPASEREAPPLGIVHTEPGTRSALRALRHVPFPLLREALADLGRVHQRVEAAPDAPPPAPDAPAPSVEALLTGRPSGDA